MSHEPFAHQIYYMILTDIAISMAVRTLLPEHTLAAEGVDYQPGAYHQAWAAAEIDKLQRHKVTALANAGLGALAKMEPQPLKDQAERFGVPLELETAQAMFDYYTNKRDAVLTYKR